MHCYLRIFIAILALAVSGCSLSPLQVQPTPTTQRQGETPHATVAFPPTFTPTVSPTAIPTLPATPVLDNLGSAAPLLPTFAENGEAFPDATRYQIEITLDFTPEEALAFIEGMARIRFTNTLDRDLTDLWLMLWPNDAQYQSSMSAGPVLVQDRMVLPELGLEGRGLRILLPQPLAAQETVDLSLPFAIEAGLIREQSPKRFGITAGVLLAPTFYPLIPRLREGEWDTLTAPPGGDTTNSDIAFYTVQIHAPAGLDLVASGVEISRSTTATGDQQIIYSSGPMRDFAFAAGRFEQKSRKAGDVTLNAWVLPEHSADLDKVLNAARIQMELLGELLGPYPYPELDLVDTPGAFGGIEYPGLVFLGTLGSTWVVEPTVHEVAHQWFYGLIGDDQIREPWLDEAAATYATALYYDKAVGQGQGTGFLSNIRAIVRSHPDSATPIGLGIGEYESESDYALFVYYKGALFFDALRNQLGERAFDAFLARYFQDFRYKFASADDFQRTAETVCRCDLQSLFDLWVYEGGEIFDS